MRLTSTSDQTIPAAVDELASDLRPSIVHNAPSSIEQDHIGRYENSDDNEALQQLPTGCTSDDDDGMDEEAPKSTGVRQPACSHQPPHTIAFGTGRHSDCVRDGDASTRLSRLVKPKGKLPGWRDLPNKKQLAILTLARLSEPLTQTSLRAYMFYQVKSFDPVRSNSAVASQVGILEGSFAAAQFLTAMAWGRAADSDWCGRKKVLLIGLSGTCLSCVGFGFSRSFWQAVVLRFLGGALNGNVGVMRTMISEIVKEKK